MKIKITYTIDKEEVKDKVSEIVDGVIQPLQTQLDLLVSVSSSLKEETMTNTATIQLLDSIRNQFALIDQTLEEVHSILLQYDKLGETLKQQSVPPAQQSAQQNYSPTEQWQQQLATSPSNQTPLSSQEMKQYLDLMNQSLNIQKDTLTQTKEKE